MYKIGYPHPRLRGATCITFTLSRAAGGVIPRGRKTRDNSTSRQDMLHHMRPHWKKTHGMMHFVDWSIALSRSLARSLF